MLISKHPERTEITQVVVCCLKQQTSSSSEALGVCCCCDFLRFASNTNVICFKQLVSLVIEVPQLAPGPQPAVDVFACAAPAASARPLEVLLIGCLVVLWVSGAHWQPGWHGRGRQNVKGLENWHVCIKYKRHMLQTTGFSGDRGASARRSGLVE